MIVCVPVIPGYLHSRTIPSIVTSGFSCVVYNVETPNSYFDTFYDWWHSYSSGFLIVEHDVEILPRAVTETQYNILEEMERCPEPWCVSPYNDKHLLGCSKFIPSQMEIDFDLVAALGKDWRTLDMSISRALRGTGEKQCVHRRATVHHHNYGS